MSSITFSATIGQQLFNSADPFPVDFDLAWQWLEYSRKDAAKRALETGGFIENIDYRVLHNSVGKAQGGRSSEIIMLSLECFKMLGMMAKTEQGRKIRLYFIRCEEQLKAKIKPVTGNAYTRRLNQLSESLKCPPNYWAIVQQSAHLLLAVEKQYTVKDLELLDGSIGIMYGKYRKDKAWMQPSSKASYTFPDHRGTKPVNVYRFAELPYYKEWEQNFYIPKHLPRYLQEHYGKLVKA